MGGTQSPPSAPSASETTQQTMQAEIQNYPILLQESQAANTGGTFTNPYTNQTTDFSGMSAYNQEQPIAQANLQLQQQYGVPMAQAAVAETQALDPTRYALQQSVEQNAQNQLNLGSSLSPDQENLIQQQVMQAQTQRGNIMGSNPSIDQAFAQFNMGQQLLQQREGNANSVLGYNPAGTNSSAASSLSQAGVTPQSLGFQTQQMPNTAQTMQMGLNYGAQNYGAYSSNYSADINQKPQWAQYAGLVAGIAGNFAGGMMGA